MPEPKPMGWREAEEWLSLGYRAPGPVVCRADLFRAIALARREKERAEAIGVTVKIQGPDGLGKFAASCEGVPGALGYGDTPHEAEISSRRSVVPMLMMKIKQQKERADETDRIMADLEKDAHTLIDNLEARLALADKLAVKAQRAWYKLHNEYRKIGPCGKGEDWQEATSLKYALRAYLEGTRPTSQLED